MSSTIKNKISLDTLFCGLNCLIVFIFFFHTLGNAWKHFDENIIFQETILPVPKSFSEIFEMLSLFGINQHFEASNPFYSNILNLRSDPVNFFIMLFVFYFFQKTAFAYHFLSLLIHIFNTAVLFLIINKISKHNLELSDNIRLPLVSTMTLLWSLHPVNVEPVLFATNWPTLLSYSFCMFLIYLLVNSDSSNPFLVFTLYLIALFTCEHCILLPIIIFFYLFAQNSFYNKDLRLKRIFPLLLVIIIFILYVTLSPLKENLHISSMPWNATVERVFWLSPQIFFHFIKLMIFPIHLSIDQTAFVKLSNTISEPYAIFCFVFMFGLIILAIISFFFLKKRFSFLYCILFTPFFLTLFPFLHIISPIYNLASERYLYLPLFFLVLGLSHFVFFITRRDVACNVFTIVVLFLILSVFGTRAYIRTLDWKDSFTLLNSAVKIAPNSLFKGLRETMTATSLQLLEGKSKKDAEAYQIKALISLKKAFKEYKQKEKNCQKNIPDVIKFYGLDPKTLKAKTAFLIAFVNYDLNNDHQKAYKILSPYINNITCPETIILNFYYKILFFNNKIDEAEKLLLKSLRDKRYSSTLFVALSDLTEYKYKDLPKTEYYLKESLKYFPYDPLSLFGLKRLYKMQNDVRNFTHYSYLYGIRNHDALSLQESVLGNFVLNNKEEARKIIKKLYKYYPLDQISTQLKARFENAYGKL